MVPPEVFSLLAIGRVMGELRISTGDAAMDKARRRVVNRDAAGNMIDRYWKVMIIPQSEAHYIWAGRRESTVPKGEHMVNLILGRLNRMERVPSREETENRNNLTIDSLCAQL
jgi:hypothetical protein